MEETPMEIGRNKMFGGYNKRYKHYSPTLGCAMTFSVFFPPSSPSQKLPVIDPSSDAFPFYCYPLFLLLLLFSIWIWSNLTWVLVLGFVLVVGAHLHGREFHHQVRSTAYGSCQRHRFGCAWHFSKYVSILLFCPFYFRLMVTCQKIVSGMVIVRYA